ncbi:hypothetical protein [Blautia sp. An81]|uniref:hypothetical protein n=1 Tax=Blautia sp. An81 TaxID=1965659 RepID=UPI000B39263A|nr:hypothetical protein [Blautia sp. An81]OUN25286.1 hypothetical protein B5G33_18290 [Blautia sp. An81]
MKQRYQETFLLNIQNHQNATWQGTVTWVDRRQRHNFRSTLELIKLIESAFDVYEKKEGEETEHED